MRFGSGPARKVIASTRDDQDPQYSPTVEELRSAPTEFDKAFFSMSRRG